ncbi:anaerobic sulfatase maturase [Acinetobacter sp. ANC 4193]
MDAKIQHSRPTLSLPKLQGNDFYAFHSMVKPSGSQCNIDCDYCFYLHKQELLAQSKTPRMNDTVLEQHIRQYIEAQTGPEVIFTWQGGEPTLMGLDFFRTVVQLQQKYAKPNQQIFNDLQTNGIALDEEWCQFLKAHHFLVGISIDGPQALHDQLRKTKNQKSTFDYVMKAIGLLHQHQIPFNALCVINHYNAQHPLAVYRFLRDQIRPRMIQFLAAVEQIDFKTTAPSYLTHNKQIPIVNLDTAVESTVTDWSVQAKDWGIFLSTIWQEWLAQDYGRVFVDQFENTISQMLGYGAQKCTTAPICGKAVALEHNGDLYACDHFVYPEYKLGNILDTHEGHLVFSAKQQEFAYAKSQSLPNYCKSCQFLNLCFGECPKNRFITAPTHETGLNYLCEGLKIFYRTAIQDSVILQQRLGGRL